MSESTALMDQLRAALREEVVIIELSTTVSFDTSPGGGAAVVPVLRLFKPGKTSRSKPVPTLPVLVGDTANQPLSALLHMIADVLLQEGR